MVKNIANPGELPMQRISTLSDSAGVIASSAMDGCCWSKTRRSWPPLWLLVAATGLAVAMSMAAAGDQMFTTVCAEREVKVITLIEDHGARELVASFVGNDRLSRAGLMMFEARDECYRGRVAEAVALYDRIVTMLGPASASRAR
jgi:hypothetical protein